MSDSIRHALQVLHPRRKYLVGVSGGADSMALLFALRETGFRHLVVCHFDHGLRPEQAGEEEEMVTKAARGLPLELGFADTRAHAQRNKLSIEAAARDLRFRFFQSCAASARCHRLILAHHADDQLETILLNLFRGTGLAGLAGMAHVSTMGRLDIHRPLLAVTRSAIETYVRNRGVRFSEDPSNTDEIHSRNKLRHSVMPVLRRCFGDLTPVLRMAEIAAAENAWLEELTPCVGMTLAVRELAAQPLAARRRMVRAWLRNHRVPEVGFTEVERVLTLLDIATAKVNLPKGLHARRRSGVIFLEP